MSTYILKGGLQEGPYDDEHVQNLLKEGTVRPDDLGWRAGMQSWQKLSTLYPGVHNPAEPPPLPSPIVPPPQPIGKPLPSGKTLGIAVAILACAFLAATVGHILLSLVLGCIGGTLLGQAFFPRAALKWKLAIGVGTGLLCIVWGVAAKTSGEAVPQPPPSKPAGPPESVPQPPPSKPAGPPESVLLRPGPYQVSASFKRGEPLVSKGIAGVPIGAIIYPVRYSSDTNGTYYFFHDSFEDWQVFYKLEMDAKIFGPFPCRM